MQYVEYIQNGTGTGQTTGWSIPLNYHPSTTNDVVMKVKLCRPSGPPDGNLTVGCSSGEGNFFRLFTYLNGEMVFDCPNDSDWRNKLPFSADVPTEWEMGAKPNDGGYYLKNVTNNTVVTGTSQYQRNFQGDFYVYGDDASSKNATERQKIYYVEIYENGTKVKDYRPAIDSNNVVCLYEKIGGTYHYNQGNKTLIAGPSISSIAVDASKTSLAASGETINITVTCENAWTVSQVDNWLTLSSSGAAGTATITATAPSYSGTTARTDTLTFTDTVTGDEAEITIRQRKYTIGQPFYLGTNEVSEVYLGSVAITEAYLGDVQVFSTGPFVGLKVTPSEIEFNSAQLTSTIKVKSSESWSMTLPAWLSASQTTGGTGETTVTLTATAQSSATSGTIVVTSANYSASATVNYTIVEFVNYVYQNSGSYIQSSHLDTGIAHTASTMTVRLKYQAKGGNSDRMVGYQEGDAGCGGDGADFRIFGYGNGNFDYGNGRWSTGVINTNGQAYDITIGDRFAYNNLTSTYLVNQGTIGSVPSPNCHILVDLSYIKVNEVIIMDGNTVLFDGKAAKMGNDYGLYDTVGGTFITSTDFVIVGDCDAECQCLNNGGQWVNNQCVYPSANKTLTVTNIEESMNMGQDRTCSMTGVFDFISTYDDIEMQATNTLTTESGYTGSYANNTITVTGPFDGSGYVVRCGGLAGGCDSISNDISVTFTGDTATVQADFATTTDPECECMQQGGTWDGSICTYPEDPCIADPCMCDPNPDECYCIQQGGTWNGSECVFE